MYIKLLGVDEGWWTWSDINIIIKGLKLSYEFVKKYIKN